MTKPAKFAHRFKLVFRHSSILLKCAVLAAIVLSIVALISLRSALMEVQEKNQDLRSQAAELEEANRELGQDISAADTDDGIRKIAREILGLVDPKSTFFTPAD